MKDRENAIFDQTNDKLQNIKDRKADQSSVQSTPDQTQAQEKAQEFIDKVKAKQQDLEAKNQR